MKVAVYHPWVYLKGGAERTILELAQRSRHDWTVYTNHFDREGTFPEFGDLPVVELGRVSVRRTVLHVGIAALRVLLDRIPLDGHSALMISSEGLGNLLALRALGLPVFCFCHTPLKIVYDPFTRARYLAERPSILSRCAVQAYTAVDRLAWRNYERVFCNSHEVANRVRNAGLAPRDRLEVVHPGVDLDRFDPNGSSEPFFLLAGRIAKTKNVELGIDAFRRFKERTPGAAHFRLLIAGMVDAKSQPYYRALRARVGEADDITFVVGPSDAVLFDLYRRCYATLFTALNEDWGLVVLEAMASGKPVVSVGRGGPCESVVDGETGYLLPADPDAFASTMGRLVAQPQLVARLGAAGRRRASAFTWDVFVSRIDRYVEALAGLPIGADESREAVVVGGRT